MLIQEELHTLNDFESDENSVLSLYLNTDPADPEQRNDAWRIHLKNEMKDLEEMIPRSTDKKELKLFKATEKKALKEIEAKQSALNKGIVIFASEDPKLWSVHYVQVPVKTSFHWGRKPELEQLHYMNKAYPNSGVILPGLEVVRILDTSMGIVNDELIYEFDAGSKQWWHNKDTASGSIRNSNAKHVEDFEGRIRENLLRFYKEMGTIVEKLKQERQWKEIHISGEAELANSFAKTLQTKPKSCQYKNLNNSDSNKVLHNIFEK